MDSESNKIFISKESSKKKYEYRIFAFVGTIVILVIVTIVVPVALYLFSTPKQESAYQDVKAVYMQRRERIIEREGKMRIGGQLLLTPDEQIVDRHLLQLKRMEIENSLTYGKPFPPRTNFLESKPIIEQSPVYHFIKKMPKGGALHLHEAAMVDIHWLIKNVTYRDNCYMCVDVNSSTHLKFFRNPPIGDGCSWQLVREKRKQAKDQELFDSQLADLISLGTESIHQTRNQVWDKFMTASRRLLGLMTFKPVLREYLYKAFTGFYEDNVQFIEIRANLGDVYDLSGPILNVTGNLEFFIDVIDEFKSDNSDFIGVKLILSSLRYQTISEELENIKTSLKLLETYPDYFSGYDISMDEEKYNTNLYFIDVLLYPATRQPPVHLPYFFHAGETDWQGTRVDENMIDAILLNTSRIGHGYALSKHPELLRLVREMDIAIEVNPISNQVLKLVDNLQNHPAASLIAQGYPVVISADDCAVWNSSGLSFDFYAAFMALSGEHDGLTLIKQFAINSIKYSSLSDAKKQEAMRKWEKKWLDFINDIVISIRNNNN